MRSILSLALVCALSGCATQKMTPICPPVIAWPVDVQAQTAAELEKHPLSEMPATHRSIGLYIRQRDVLDRCSRSD